MGSTTNDGPDRAPGPSANLDRRSLLVGALATAAAVACGADDGGPTATPTSEATDVQDTTPGAGDAVATTVAAGRAGDGAGGPQLLRSDAARVAGDGAVRAGGLLTPFAVELYRQVAAATEDDNVVFSPASVAFALAMAANGAAGTTLAEMLGVLGPGTIEELNGALNSMEQAISTRSGMRQGGFQREAEVTLRVANSLWGQQGLAFDPAFLDRLAAYYGAGLHTVDYVTAAEAARGAINAWVDEQTAGKITELIAPGILNPDSRLVLANAILLTAPWFEPFVKEATTAKPFTTASGQQVTTDMMSGTQTSGYARGSGWTAVDIPYLGGELAMTVVVPDAGGWQEFEAGLDGATLQAIFDGLVRRKYMLTLPRWTSRTSAAMAPMLATMGMPQAFSGAADFSAMTTEERLFISAVAHQAYIAVDEDGTEAAAATAVIMERTSAAAEPPPVVDVDRPFLYAIRDLPTSTVLFLGRVLDPTLR